MASKITLSVYIPSVCKDLTGDESFEDFLDDHDVTVTVKGYFGEGRPPLEMTIKSTISDVVRLINLARVDMAKALAALEAMQEVSHDN